MTVIMRRIFKRLACQKQFYRHWDSFLRLAFVFKYEVYRKRVPDPTHFYFNRAYGVKELVN